MKKTAIIMSLLGILLMSNGIFAQENGKRAQMEQLTPAQKAEKRTASMKKDLSLSATQVEKIQAINLKYFTATQQTRKDMELLREKMEKERSVAKAEINAVLTPAQQEIMNKKEAERMEKRQENHGQHGKKE